MSKFNAALGAAMLLLASTPAHAAFLTYTIKAYGVGLREQQFPSSVDVVSTSLNGAILTFGFNEVANLGFGTGVDFQTRFNIENVGLQTLFSFAPIAGEINYLASGSGSLCSPNVAVGGLPQSSSGFSTNCGSLSYNLTVPRGPLRERFTGGVEFVTVTRSATGTDFFSIQSIVGGVPEPTTWAMMLTGFALTSYALRRRTIRVMPV